MILFGSNSDIDTAQSQAEKFRMIAAKDWHYSFDNVMQETVDRLKRDWKNEDENAAGSSRTAPVVVGPPPIKRIPTFSASVVNNGLIPTRSEPDGPPAS